MDHLRGLFETIGFSNVETFIASGNVIFDSKSKNTRTLEQKIAGHLHQMLGYEVATFVRAISDLTGIADYKPFGDSALDAEGAGIYIAFLADTPGDEAKQKLLSFSTKVDQLHVHEREVYWLFYGRSSDSEFSGALLEK